MNCLEFHRAKLADPRRLPPDAQHHLAQCSACAAFAEGVDQTERELERTLSAGVPDGLADRVLLRVQSSRPRRRAWALAAGVMLAVAVGAVAWLRAPATAGQHARDAIEHVAAEPASLTTVQSDTRDLGELVRAMGGQLKQPLGKVRYVKLCPVPGGSGWHVVLETPQGLATLFIVPEQPLEAAQYASSSKWNALARPAPRGYYAVVTASAAHTLQIDRMIREQVDWST
jgi:hypothetical protein